MYCIPKNFLKFPSVLVCIDCWINKISLSLSCREDVGTLSNLVKYCVDCFSLLFSVLVVFGTFLAASSLRQVGGFLREVVVPRAQQLVSEHPRFGVGSRVDSRASVAVWRRSCVDLGAALGLFVRSCVDLKTACRLLEESIWWSRLLRKLFEGFAWR